MDYGVLTEMLHTAGYLVGETDLVLQSNRLRRGGRGREREGEGGRGGRGREGRD